LVIGDSWLVIRDSLFVVRNSWFVNGVAPTHASHFVTPAKAGVQGLCVLCSGIQNFAKNVMGEQSVKTFIWNQHFITGLESVDGQHQRLVDLINRLGESLIAADARGDAALRPVFDELADYAKYHFSEEERLMLESGLASGHSDLHELHHAQFVEPLSSIWNSRGTISNPGVMYARRSLPCAWHVLTRASFERPLTPP